MSNNWISDTKIIVYRHRRLKLAAAAGATVWLAAVPEKAHAIHAVCSFVSGAEQQVLVVQDDDCSDPFTPFVGGRLVQQGTRFYQDVQFDTNTVTTGTSTFNGASSFNSNTSFGAGTTATFDGSAVFNGTVTWAGAQNFSGINNTGNIATDTLSTTGNATIGGTLGVSGLATFNGITNTGNITTDTLTANTSINTPLITATTANITNANVTNATITTANVTTANITTANVTTANITTANVTTANVTTANISTANITSSLQVSPGATVNMGGNRVQNVAAPIAATDAANRAYVDAGIAGVSNQVEQAVGLLNTRIDDVSQRTNKATGGVAMAMAMAGVPTVLPNERVAFTMNYGNFQGQNGVAINGAIRLDNHLQLTAGVGYATNQSIVGARAGLRVGW